MKPTNFFYCLLLISIVCIITTLNTGCAQIGQPTGGPKDTLPPVLVNATPQMRALHFSGNKVVFTFDEFVNVQDVQGNLLVSPYPKKAPAVTNKLKTVTIVLKDSLLPNTTYSLNFGNAIMDVDENNVLKNFTYVFSTGNYIDSEKVTGKLLMAATGKTDSSLLIFLYKDLSDSAVEKKRPNYVARVDRKGEFTFRHLPPGDFKIYALKDDDGSFTYDAKTEAFAFYDSIIHVSDSTPWVNLYAYTEEEKTTPPAVITAPAKNKKASKDNKLHFTSSIATTPQDLLSDLLLTFNKPLAKFDSTGILLTDTNYNSLLASQNITIDSTRKIVRVHASWMEGADYRLIINRQAVSDSDSVFLRRTDTLAFKTLNASDYGTILIRVINFDKSKHPVLEFIQQDVIVKSVPLQKDEWSDNLFPPGDYHIRILLDDNNNGKWDPGSYEHKRQPEKVISFEKILTIKADWDNEREIQL